MRKRKPVVHHRNIHRRLPIIDVAVVALVLKVFNAPQWVWGSVGTLCAIIFGFWVYDVLRYDEEEIDLFPPGPDEKTKQ